jgi:ABC-2 type transport system ATP-binding protein
MEASGSTEPVLRLENVSKHFSGHTAVDQLSLEIGRGSIHGLLGPNGAGKSTTLRMIMNVLLRDEGRLEVLGRDPERDRSVLRRVGYLPEERGLYKRMKDRAEARRRGTAWLERLGLEQWIDERVETLSKGMQQKVQFVATVLHDPELLILDEPQSGLDPVNQEILADTIRSARREGRTVVLSTHNMAQAEELCDRVTLIAGGRKVLEGAVPQLRRRHRLNVYRLVLDSDSSDWRPLARRTDLVRSAELRDGHVVEIEVAEARTSRDLLEAVLAARLQLVRFEQVEPTLHEIFLQHVGDAAPHATRRETIHV